MNSQELIALLRSPLPSGSLWASMQQRQELAANEIERLLGALNTIHEIIETVRDHHA